MVYKSNDDHRRVTDGSEEDRMNVINGEHGWKYRQQGVSVLE